LDQQDLNQAYHTSFDPVNNIARMISQTDVLHQTVKTPVANSIGQVDQALHNFSKTVQDLKQTVMRQIREQEHQYFFNSTELFNTGYRNDSVNHIFRRTMPLSETTAGIFLERLKIHVSWQHPGLIFRPVHLAALHDIVALDPMYLVDTHQELLNLAVQPFDELYQRRLRTYVINEYVEGAILDCMPRDQFGLVAAQNFLNFKPIEVVNRYITEVYDLLKPGGAFIFTYNNCDYAGPVELAERCFTCYTPGRLIKKHAVSAGYRINYEHNELNGACILELRKPGSRPSLRGGQVLAWINDPMAADSVNTQAPNQRKKSKVPKAIDTAVTKHYTDKERIELQMSAIVLGIDTRDNILKNYTTEKLDQLVSHCLNNRDVDNDKFQKRLDKLINQRKNT
jgi:SAM-dependent methyltransferase